MPEVSVKPSLPIAATTPVGNQAESAKGSPSQPEGAQSFSSVLREKQAAKASEKSAASEQKPAPDKASGADQALPEETAKDAAALPDLAQWLASVSLQSRMTEGQEKAEPASTDPASDAGLAGMLILPTLPHDKTAAGDKSAGSPANLAADPAIARVGSDGTRDALLDKAVAAPDKSAPDDKGDLPSVSEPSIKAQEVASPSRESAAPSFASMLDQAGLNSAQQAELARHNPATGAQAPAAGQSNVRPTAEVHTPVGHAGWAEEVGSKLVWSANQNAGKAELVLTPAHLGRVEVSIDLKGDQASASFVAVNPVAREALQDAMPKLREMLAQSGIQLGQADVGAGQSGQGSTASGGEQRRGQTGAQSGAMSESAMNEVASARQIRTGSGLVDTFA